MVHAIEKHVYFRARAHACIYFKCVRVCTSHVILYEL